MKSYAKVLELIKNEIFYLTVENEALRDEIWEVDEKWLSKSKDSVKLYQL